MTMKTESLTSSLTLLALKVAMSRKNLRLVQNKPKKRKICVKKTLFKMMYIVRPILIRKLPVTLLFIAETLQKRTAVPRV